VTALAVTARAGYKASGVNVGIGESFLYGQIGSVRSSADGSQYIGCLSYDYVTSVSVWCFAQDISGAYASCSVSGPAGWQPLASIGPNSLIDVSFHNGTCTTIRVSNTSYWPIAVP